MLYINSCCCTCLSTENLQSIHIKDEENVKVLDKLLYCLAEKDYILECAPLLVCSKCFKSLTDLYNFKKYALKSLDQIKNCLKQLVRAPFADLAIGEAHRTEETIATTTNETRQESTTPLIPAEEIKKEPNCDNESQIDNQYSAHNSRETRRSFIFEGASTSSTANQSLPVQIQTVETLNNVYKKQLDFTPKLPPFHKGTICEPCGKKFVRDDFFIKHVLTCPNSDISMKNSVLNWATKRDKLKIVRGPNSTTFQLINNKEKPSTKVENPVNMVERGVKTKRIWERSSCRICKKQVATRFLKRHTNKCNRERLAKQLKLLKQSLPDGPKIETPLIKVKHLSSDETSVKNNPSDNDTSHTNDDS